MVQYAPGIDLIERGVGKLQALGIPHGQGGGQPKGRQSSARMLNRPLGEVHAPEIRTGLGKALMIRP